MISKHKFCGLARTAHHCTIILTPFPPRLKEQEDDFKDQKAEYEREIRHLRLLLREREDKLENLVGEKR